MNREDERQAKRARKLIEQRDKLIATCRPLLPPGIEIVRAFPCRRTKGPTPQPTWGDQDRGVLVARDAIYVVALTGFRGRAKEVVGALPLRPFEPLEVINFSTSGVHAQFTLIGERHFVRELFIGEVRTANRLMAEGVLGSTAPPRQ